MKVLDTYQPIEGQPMTNERTYEDVNEIDPMSGPEGHGGTPDRIRKLWRIHGQRIDRAHNEAGFRD